MSWSLGEIQALAIKATRGAGFSWGLAEEAGQAVRRLEQAGLPGLDALAGYLTVIVSDKKPLSQPRSDQGWNSGVASLGTQPDSQSPEDLQSQWLQSVIKSAGSKPLCPLLLGAAISDLRIVPSGTIPDVFQPLLLAPFLVRNTGQTDIDQKQVNENHSDLEICRLTFAKAELIITGTTVFTDSNREALLCERGPCQLEQAQGVSNPNKRSVTNTRVEYSEAEAVKRLNALAERTYAPATDASREAGAGAGLTDND